MTNQQDEFHGAFESWLESERSAIKLESSKAIYRSIWNAFARSVGPGVPLLRVTGGMVADYLVSRSAAAAARAAGNDEDGDEDGLTIRYQARVARLIEKVMEHHATTKGEDPMVTSPVQVLMKANPELGAALLREPSSEPPLDYLSEKEHHTLKAYLVSNCEQDLKAGNEVKWSEMRDRASLALQLGGGLTPSDVRKVTLQEVNRGKGGQVGEAGRRYITVPKNGKLAERNVRLDPWAAVILENWLGSLRGRRDNGFSFYVFPGDPDKNDGQWSKPGQHKQTTKLLASLGIRSSSFKLRHTWALNKLREGASERQVAKWLGVLDGGEVMKRYQAVLLEELEGPAA